MRARAPMSQMAVAQLLGTPLIRVIETERESLAKCRTWCAVHGITPEDIIAAWPRLDVEQPDLDLLDNDEDATLHEPLGSP